MRALRRTVSTSGRTDRGQRQRTSQCLHLPPQDLHGVIILEDEQTEESVVTDIAEETGLLDPNGCGKTLRVGGGGSITKKHNYQHVIVNPGGGAESNRVSHNGNGQ